MEKKYFKAEDYQPDGYIQGIVSNVGIPGSNEFKNFFWRDFILHSSDDRFIKFKLSGGLYTLYDKFVRADNEIKVYYIINSRECKEKWFTDAIAVKIELIKGLEEFEEAYLNDELDGYKPEDEAPF